MKKFEAVAINENFAELYRSAFAETDPHAKQLLLRQVQSLIDTWHFEEQKNHGGPPLTHEPSSQIIRIAS
jgi:hypothetical protein